MGQFETSVYFYETARRPVSQKAVSCLVTVVRYVTGLNLSLKFRMTQLEIEI
jgi:hypothetical protein